MHTHTSACSGCSKITYKDIVLLAKKHGYSGIVLTNHFYKGNTCVSRELSFPDFVEEYYKDYKNAKAFGREIGVDVFFGIEEAYNKGKEVLIYGIHPKTLAACKNFNELSIAEISKFVRENGGLIFCAHPFRHRGYIEDADVPPDMQYFDGIELYNACNTDEDNALALDFFKNQNCLAVSGGDVHHPEDFGRSGIAFETRPANTEEFISLIKTKQYKLIINGSIENAH